MAQFGTAGQFGGSGDTLDPTEVVKWGEAGPTSGATIQPGAGADLRLLNDDGEARIIIAGADGQAQLIAPDSQDWAIRNNANSSSFLRAGDNVSGVVIGPAGPLTVADGGGNEAFRVTTAGEVDVEVGPLIFFSALNRATEEGRITPTANLIVFAATGGADLQLHNDQANVGLNIQDGANGGAVLSPDGTGTGAVASSDLTDAFNANTTSLTIVRNNSQQMEFTDAEARFQNAVPVVYYNGGGSDERWRLTSTVLQGQGSVPADGASSASALIRLRINNDPLGAGALETFDFELDYIVGAGGGTADVDTFADFQIRGVQAMGLFHDEGVNKCALLLPSWDVSVDGVAGLPDGVIIYDATGAAGNRFMGVHAGAFVALG